MFVVTVTFEVSPEHVDQFRAAVIQQARNSLQKEEACRQFDVCFSPESPGLCFLYEKYDDQAAFDLHVTTEHFANFSAKIGALEVSKTIQTWNEQV